MLYVCPPPCKLLVFYFISKYAFISFSANYWISNYSSCLKCSSLTFLFLGDLFVSTFFENKLLGEAVSLTFFSLLCLSFLCCFFLGRTASIQDLSLLPNIVRNWKTCVHYVIISMFWWKFIQIYHLLTKIKKSCS